MIDIIDLARYPGMFALLEEYQSSVGSTETHYNANPFSFLDSPFRDNFLELCGEMLRNCVFRIGTNAEGFMHRHQGTWFTIRSCSRNALMLLGGFKWCQKAARGIRKTANTSGANESSSNYLPWEQQENTLKLIEGLVPRGYREAVEAVYNFTAVWAEDSADIRRLHEIIGALMNQISEEESERGLDRSMGILKTVF
jgi:hypothetical protein